MNTILTPEIEQILSVHNQLWEGASTISYKDQIASSYQPDHGGYRSVQLNNAKGIPHLWITQNMNNSTYGSYSISRAAANGQRLRITWIIATSHGEYRYVGRIETHQYFDSLRQDRTHIETYHNDDVTVVYTNNEAYQPFQAVL